MSEFGRLPHEGKPEPVESSISKEGVAERDQLAIEIHEGLIAAERQGLRIVINSTTA